jgi:nucleoid-associated protein YgaU
MALSFCLGPDSGGAGPAAPKTAATGKPAVPDQAAQVEELTRRVRGMEGKLKDSAVTRKSAEQARMESERRLAQRTQEAERLAAEVRALRDGKAALDARIKRLEEQGARGAAALATAQASLRRLAGERDTQCAQAEPRPPGSDRGAGERPEPARSVGPDTKLPDPAVDEARSAAATVAAELRAASGRPGGARAGPAGRTPRELERTLYRDQLAVARAAGARTVYRVAPGDTLAIVGARVYRDGSRWREIYEANRHVLSDPDRLMTGMTLVIP